MRWYIWAFVFLYLPLVGTARIVSVCQDCKVRSIQAAIDAAQPGDTIVIDGGRWNNEETIVLSKPLTLRGINNPVIDGLFRGTIILVRADNVRIEGITLMNTGFSALEEYAAIRCVNIRGCQFERISTRNCTFGILLYRCSDVFISDIECIGTKMTESLSGNGIHLWKSYKCTVKTSRIEQHRDGLYFEFSSNCYIVDNQCERNLRYGLHFMFSDSNTYINNRFERNGAGVAVMYSKYVRMAKNLFIDNWGPSSYGLLLKDISYSIIDNNSFIRNTTGVYLEGSDYTFLGNNYFQSNGWAIKLLGSAQNDTLASNTFVGNTFDLLVNSFLTRVICYRNYWDQYRGYDLNHDGLGDVPFRPISLMSYLVERIPLAILLARSFIAELLSFIERVIPTLTPSHIIDENPSIHPTIRDAIHHSH